MLAGMDASAFDLLLATSSATASAINGQYRSNKQVYVGAAAHAF